MTEPNPPTPLRPADQRPEEKKDGARAAAHARETLDERLDEGIDETFPGSDPVSVKVSKYAPGDPREAEKPTQGGEGHRGGEGFLPGITEQARDAASAVSERVGAAVRDLSEGGRRMAPALERGSRVIRETVNENRVPAAIIGGLIGCGVAFMFYRALSHQEPRKQRRRAYGANEIS